ncbi:MAG TPA: hypothetical protein VF522_15820 [Ramlibacter sp.]|uniref:hypothetical protein n=1 Tax=Ramlibacter sp. TaxID=1917967 RepID=UPI002ED53E28
MSSNDPYAPPVAPVADIAPPEGTEARRRLQRYLFATCVALQFAGTLLFAPWLLELVRTGSVSALTFSGTVIGDLALYGGTMLVLTQRPAAKIAFGVAAVLLLASLRGWTFQSAPGWLAAYGVLLAAYGLYLVRRLRQPA